MRLQSLSFLLAVACTGDDTDTVDTDGGDTDVSAAVCTEAKDVACVDAMILDLALHDDLVSDGDVTTETDGEDFVTAVDATAGGFGNETQNPWVYVKFTETGAERVDIDDETALESLEWHIAARRFILRLNGGDNAPSCVGASAFLEKSYEELTEVPDGLVYEEDHFYTDAPDCTIVNDSSGLPGSPQVALAPWWSYEGCVQTTGNPFLIRLEDGRVIKLRVEQYYATDQDVCNSTGSGGSGSGNLVWRWRFVE